MIKQAEWTRLNPPEDLADVFKHCPGVHIASGAEQLRELALGDPGNMQFNVDYELPDGRTVTEAVVARVRNGVSVNYPEPYMRRRDPNCMYVADDGPSDKPRYMDAFDEPFDVLRQATYDWLKQRELAVMAFQTGRAGVGDYALAVVPANAGFFALGLSMLQGIIDPAELPEDFEPKAVIYVAPPFRHTHFEGRQVVVHDRRPDLYQMYSYNLYPGPSAKKGVYGMLIEQGEKEGWITAHCSAVQVITPYDNIVTIMHEGASGGGKSEMLEQPHRQPDGRLLLGRNLKTGEERFLRIPQTCDLRPVTDDMALCHPSLQRDNRKLWLTDAENAWFVRVNHIVDYGTDLELERLTAKPPSPLLFLNIDAVPNGRAMIWEPSQDEPGVPCPNPRVVIPRSIVPGIVSDAVSVDIRSMGVRTPPCTRENPSYGIMGLFHVLPPALAWLWRLVAPRGHGNPSISHTEGIKSEGVGSYWPFATGRRVTQANLLLRQIQETPQVQYILVPNQHVGAWETGFMPQWIARDYLARRGIARFRSGQLVSSRCSLLGYAIYSMQVEGTQIPHWFLQVETQPEVGEDGYDRGARQLSEFFMKSVKQFLDEDLDPLGRKIIQCCLDGGSVEDYESLIERTLAG